MPSLGETPKANRFHITLLGITNVGKSSLINTLTDQEVALVSEIKGTTTDPVYKAMELAPLGPVVFIDTAGLDDQSELGELRRAKTLEVLHKTDLALLVCDATIGITKYEKEILQLLKAKEIPFLVLINKIDLLVEEKSLPNFFLEPGIKLLPVSTYTKRGIPELRKAIINSIPQETGDFFLVGDLVTKGDFVILVVPLDQSAPKGRLILPQQQTLRDLLDHEAVGIVTGLAQLKKTLANLATTPRLVITDSQVFSQVAQEIPENLNLTSFSILFARQKGDLKKLQQGIKKINNLQDGDKILIAEACTHHRQDDDIGTVKIPRWLQQKTGKKLIFETNSGYSFPSNLREYALIVHCAGCMLNRRAMLHRLDEALKYGVPIVNYGVLIAYLHGILERALKPFTEL